MIGVVHAGSEAFAQFVEDDARLLELIADRIALAINQASLYEAERAAQQRLRFLGEASALLGSSLDVEQTLEQLGELVAGRVADWCSIHLVAEADGPRLVSRRATHDAATGAAARVVGAQAAASRRRAQAGRARRSGRGATVGRIRASLIVPLERARADVRRDRARLGRASQPYDDADLEFALDLARRAAVAIDNAQLYRAAEERAQAARVLASVGDGVFLVDRTGFIRTWNRAAAIATGLPRVGGRRPSGRRGDPRLGGDRRRASPSRRRAAPRRAPESLPLDLGGRELWLSIHGVAVPDGIVYAFRDLTEERALEQMRTEFVSTVSHELRTPLAAIYGAAMTLRRSDVALDESSAPICSTSSRARPIASRAPSTTSSGRAGSTRTRCT